MFVKSDADVQIPKELLTRWADSCLRMNHLGTLIIREMAAVDQNARALDLTERARRRAWALFNEMLEHGAEKPENYREPGTA